jgi:hypothetical protein
MGKRLREERIVRILNDAEGPMVGRNECRACSPEHGRNGTWLDNAFIERFSRLFN